MAELCEITGVVAETEGGIMKVRTEPDAACAGCGGKLICGSSGRLLTVQGDYPAGSKVRLELPFRSGFMLTFLLYMLATLAAIAFAALIYFFSGTEMLAAVGFILSVLVWFATATVLLKRYAAKKIKVTLIN